METILGLGFILFIVYLIFVFVRWMWVSGSLKVLFKHLIMPIIVGLIVASITESLNMGGLGGLLVGGIAVLGGGEA